MLEKLPKGMLGERIAKWKSSERLELLKKSEFSDGAGVKIDEGNKLPNIIGALSTGVIP